MNRILMKTLLTIFFLSFPFTLNAATVDEFIPHNSLLYVKLNGLEDILGSIENDEMAGILGILGASKITDILGNSSGLAIWLDKKHRVNAAYVVDTKGDMVLIQRLKKIAPRLLGVFATTHKQGVGKHRSIEYGELNLDENKILFGYADEFLVIGVGERSFKTVIDTYQNRSPSILERERFVEATQKIGAGDISVYSNITTLDNKRKWNALRSWKNVLEELTPFTYIFATLNLHESENFLKVYAPLTLKALQNINEKLPIQTQLPNTLDSMRTIRSMSGKDDLFIAMSPIVTQTIWSILGQVIEQDADGGFYDALDFFESELNVDFYDDVIPALTGEIALSISKFQPFTSPIRGEIDLSFEASFDSDGNFEIDMGLIERFGVIFSSINRTKWNELNNAFANKGNTTTIQFFEYDGTTVSEIADSVFLSNKNELLIASVDEDNILSLIDTLSTDRHFPIDMEQVSQSSIVCLQLNLITLLEAIIGSEHIPNPEDVLSLFSWLSVEDNALILQAAFLENKSPLNSLAKLLSTTVNGIVSSLKESEADELKQYSN